MKQNKIMLSFLATMFALSGVTLAALPYSFESNSEFREHVLNFDGTPAELIENLEYACKNVLVDGEPWVQTPDNHTYLSVTTTSYQRTYDPETGRYKYERVDDPTNAYVTCKSFERTDCGYWCSRATKRTLWYVRYLDLTADEVEGVYPYFSTSKRPGYNQGKEYLLPA